MKFLKRILGLDQYSDEAIAAEYSNMSDAKLASLNPSELSAVGLRCYRAQMELRKGREGTKVSADRAKGSSQ